MTRQEANRKILNLISETIESSPDLRFHQILQSLNIENTIVEFEPNGRPSSKMYCEDLFHEESVKTIERMNINNDIQI